MGHGKTPHGDAHAHEDVENHDDPDAFDTLYIGLVGAFIVAALVAAFSGVWYWIDQTAAASFALQPNAALVSLDAEQTANVNRTGVVTRPDGEEAKAMPIEEAMRQIVREQQAR